MRKLVSFMHVSLDGFIAGPNGEMDWIKVDEEIFDYAEHRTNVANTALYGRATYEIMEAYWPTAADKPDASKHDKEHSRWYKKVEKIVLSRSMKDKKMPGVKIISENISTEISKLKQAPGTEIIMFGSPSSANFLIQEGLVDEFWLFVNPILLGDGIPFFKNLTQRTKLKLVKSHAFTSGVVCLHYEK